MNKVVLLFLAFFATYRLAELLSIDAGPFAIFQRTRKFFGKKAGGKTYKNFYYNVAELLSCVFCSGVWVSIAIGTIYLFFLNPYTEAFITIFGIAGVQTFLESRGANDRTNL